MVNGLRFGECYGYTAPREIVSQDERTWMLEGVYAAGTGPGLGLAYTHLLDGRSPGDPEPLHTSPSSDATAKKVVAYIIRCLKNPEIDLTDEDATWKRALEIGLVKETDSIACDPVAPISPDDFFVLMYRFVQQPKYFYFDLTGNLYTERAEWCYTYYNGNPETYAEYLERIIPMLKERGKFMHLTNSRLHK